MKYYQGSHFTELRVPYLICEHWLILNIKEDSTENPVTQNPISSSVWPGMFRALLSESAAENPSGNVCCNCSDPIRNVPAISETSVKRLRNLGESRKM